uniref:Putative mam and ldl-receptor class a domain-containing protein n=2 Tax=Ixodes ricinus TaxID=34613 RepID=V5H6Z6_IXORI
MAKRHFASLRFWVLGIAFLLVVTNAPTGRAVADNFDCGTVPERAIKPNRVCDFVVDCANGADEVDCGNCDFDNTTCGWSLGDPGNRKSMRWQRIRVGELDGSPKINPDQTTDGHYMILVREEESKYTTEEAVASSPVIRNTNVFCAISFWCNYANDTSNVTLELEVKGYKMIVWSLLAREPKLAQGIWNLEAVVLGRYRGEVKLNFLGILRDAGYFVIDSIEYNHCRLPQPKNSCEDGFRCANGACIPRRDVCNAEDNCGDDSDELNCGDYKLGCNFDTSFCDWQPVVLSKNDSSFVKWVRSRPEKDLRYGPTRDHTTGLPTGRFLHLRAGNVKGESEIAGPVLQVNGSCAITFFYVIYNGAPSTLTLGARYAKNGSSIKIWDEKEHSGLFKFTKVYKILSPKNPFQVFFKGTHEATNNAAYISIDDVSFTPGCRPYEVGLTTPDSATPSTDATPTKPVGLTTPDSATSSTDATPTKTVALTTPDSATSSTDATPTKTALAKGTIAAITVTVVLILVVVLIIIAFLYQRRSRSREELNQLNETSGEQANQLLSTSPSTDTDQPPNLKVQFTKGEETIRVHRTGTAEHADISSDGAEIPEVHPLVPKQSVV